MGRELSIKFDLDPCSGFREIWVNGRWTTDACATTVALLTKSSRDKKTNSIAYNLYLNNIFSTFCLQIYRHTWSDAVSYTDKAFNKESNVECGRWVILNSVGKPGQHRQFVTTLWMTGIAGGFQFLAFFFFFAIPLYSYALSVGKRSFRPRWSFLQIT